MGSENVTTEGTPGSEPGRPDLPPHAPPDPARGPRPELLTVVPRWIQLVALPTAAVAMYLVARAAGSVLLLFLVAGVIALVLNPLVAFLQRRRLHRGFAILLVYLGLLVTAATAGILLANPVSDQAARFGRDVPRLGEDANERLADLQRTLDDKGINIEISRQGETALQTLQERVIGGTSDIVNFGGEILRRVVTAGFALILIIVLSIYMLVYGERIGAVVRSVMPRGDGSPKDDYPTRLQRAVGGYLRGQALFSLAMGTGAGVGMWIFGLIGIFPEGGTYAFAFGAWFGLMELIPFVGPFLGALPPLIVALFSDPLTAVWVGIFFIALQQLEGHVVAPYIFGHALRINPLLVMFALLTGGEAYGIVGALIALPLAAIIRETFVYLRRHLVMEPWGTPAAFAVLGGSTRRACGACGAMGSSQDEFCRRCGEHLTEEVGVPRSA
jgi:predicted PurR-regulated permease PerM